LISRSLPTGKLLAQRHGGKFSNLNCSICNTCQETYEHLWNCPLNKENIDCVIEFAVWDTNEQLFINSSDIDNTVISLLKPVDIPNFLPDLVRGIAISPFVEAIRTTLNDAVGFNKYIHLLRNNLKNYFRKNIWLPRCKDQIKLEKRHGISKRYKREQFVASSLPNKEEKLAKHKSICGLATLWFESLIGNYYNYDWIKCDPSSDHDRHRLQPTG